MKETHQDKASPGERGRYDDENKRAKFVELAEKRVEKALSAIRVIGNLSNRNNYQYSEEDVKKIMSALTDEVKQVQTRFKETSGRKTGFKL